MRRGFFVGGVCPVVFILILIHSSVFGQNHHAPHHGHEAEVQGHVTDAAGRPVIGANVSLSDTGLGSSTDEHGYFQIKHVPPGTYTVRASYIGMTAGYQKINIAAGQSAVITITLNSKQESLNEVVVEDHREDPLAKANSTYVAKLPLTNLENPQVYTTVSSALMEEQVVTDLDAALKNVPGAGVPVRFNQNRITFLSRGFSTQPKIRNGLTTFNQTYIDPVNLERIEVLKGPSATLFGSSVVSYGGLMNRVTKKPYDGFGGQVTYSMGSWNLNRLTLDLNTPVNGSNNLLFRMNGAVHTENSFQDAGFYNDVAVTPSLSYQLSSRATAYIDIEYVHSKGTSPIRFSPYTTNVATQNIEDLHWPYKTSYANENIYYTSQSLNVFGEFRYELSENWTSRTSFSRTRSGFDGYTTQQKGRSATTFRTQVTEGDYAYYSTDIQENLMGKFEIGSVSNRLVVGLDYYDYYNRRNTANVNTGTYDFSDPASGYYDEYTRAHIDSLLMSASRTIRYGETQTYSAYASDVINVTDRLLTMLSLRLDYFDNQGTYNLLSGTMSGDYTQAALSPKFGIVYQLLKDKVSVFGNYMNGFSNQTGTDAEGNTFSPEQANQVEGGVKLDMLANILSGSVSYYDIEVSDVLRTDPDDANYSIQDGTQVSKGLEVELMAHPMEGLSLLAGYAYNDSEYTEADESVKGLRPASAGPETLINWWASYAFSGTDGNPIKIGFGGNYGSSSYQTNTSTAQVIIPSYLTMDAMISYTIDNVSLSFKVNNLTDEHYWTYRLTPQKPRNFTLHASLGF